MGREAEGVTGAAPLGQPVNCEPIKTQIIKKCEKHEFVKTFNTHMDVLPDLGDCQTRRREKNILTDSLQGEICKSSSEMRLKT